jgi:kynureninase
MNVREGRIADTDLRALDAVDPLRDMPARFDPGRPGTLYFDANSVGAMPLAARERLQRILDDWRNWRCEGWTKSDWLEAPQRLGDKVAPVVGASAGEIVVCDTTSVNLFKALAIALGLRPERARIVTEPGTFPTDLYIAQGMKRYFPATEITYVEHPEDLPAAIDERTAALYLSHTDYRTSYRHDTASLTRAAHAKGALAVWDVSHSAGAVPVGLGAADADLAVGCGYKYLCGGPGAPAYLYVAKRLQSAAEPALTGWMGHANLYEFARDYRPAPGIDRHLVGSPVVSANAVLEAALDLWSELDIAAAFAKHAQLSDLLTEMAAARLGRFGFSVASPRAASQRGGFVALRHVHAAPIVAALRANGVICSYRLPDIIRFGLSPLYHRFSDIGECVERLERIVAQKPWDNPRYAKANAV